MAQTLKRLYQGSPLVLKAPTLGQSITVSSSGGTIPHAVTRYYRISTVYNGVETVPGNEVSTPVTVTANTDTNTLTLNWAPVIGATGYKIYEGASSGSEQLLATITDGTVNTYVDTGAVTPSGAMPSTSTLVETTATPGLYTPPSGKMAIIKHVIVSNPGVNGSQVFLSAVPSGGAGGAGNRFISGLSCPPDAAQGPTSTNLIVPIANGDFITGYVTVPGTVLTLVGVEL